MKLTLGEKTKLIELSEIASGLLVEMLEEDIPRTKKQTKKDIKFDKIISQINEICPLLADSYELMYHNLHLEKYVPKKRVEAKL